MSPSARDRFFSCVLAVMQLTALTACQLVDQADDGEIGEKSEGLWGGPSVFWPGDPPMIPVCFENPSSGVIHTPTFDVPEATARMWVREVVEGQWSRYSRVNFTEWDTCTPGAPGVHILIKKSGGSSAFGGASNNGVTDGVKLNMYFEDRPADCRASLANLQRCVQGHAIHEFGHVLGFGHEEERSDYVSVGGCAELPSPAGQQLYGAYDIDSVMSYCGRPDNDITTWDPQLSPGDIAAVQRAYGRRVAGQMVNARGADMMAHNFQAGPGVFIWDGDEAFGQRWHYDFFRQAFKTLGTGGNTVCLDTFNAPPGSQLLAGTCFFDSYQRFPLEDVYLRGYGGLCLDVPGGNTANGTTVQVWQCGALGGGNQRWSIDTQKRIRFGSTNKCLTFSPVQGSTLFLWECGGSPYADQQSFSFTGAGSLILSSVGDPLFCADVEATLDSAYLDGSGLPHNGARVQAHDCRGEQLNQKWNLSGSFKAPAGACIDVTNASNNLGAAVQTYGCNGTIAQEWDYYVSP